MKFRSAERLLLVAIVTSAVVAQVRQHTLPSVQTSQSAQTQTAQPRPTRDMQTCDEKRGVMLRAACEIRRDQRPVDGDDRDIKRAHGLRAHNGWV